MNFGETLEFMKQGNAVAREGWNGEGMFVYLVTGGKYPVQMKCVKHLADSEGKVKYNPYMAIKNVDGTVSTWVPSVNDCLANDWYGIKNTNIEKNIPAYILRMQSEYEELRIKNEKLYNFLVAKSAQPIPLALPQDLLLKSSIPTFVISGPPEAAFV